MMITWKNRKYTLYTGAIRT